PARRDAGDWNLEESIGRHRGGYHAGRRAGHHSTRGLLSRLARLAAKPSKARRTRDQSIAVRDREKRGAAIKLVLPGVASHRNVRSKCDPVLVKAIAGGGLNVYQWLDASLAQFADRPLAEA